MAQDSVCCCTDHHPCLLRHSRGNVTRTLDLRGKKTPEEETLATLNAIQIQASTTEMESWLNLKSDGNIHQVIEVVSAMKKLIKDIDLKLLELIHETHNQ